MPQTPSFFNQRGLSLYNRLVGQRLSLRSGAASATPTIGSDMIAVVLAVVVSAIVVSTATVVDQRVLSCGTPIRLVVAAVLLIASAWLESNV